MTPPEPRQDLPIPVPVKLVGPDGCRSVEYAVNLSPGGLCLHLKQPLEVGDEVEVQFELPATGLFVACAAEVIWTNRADASGDDVDDDEEEDEAQDGSEVSQVSEGEGHRFWETGLRFTDLDDERREQLHAYASQELHRRR